MGHAEDNIKLLQESIRDGLKSVNLDGNWLELYNDWKNKEENLFDSLLIIKDPFNPQKAGDREFFVSSDEAAMVDLDTIKMSVFFWKQLMAYEKKTVISVQKERLRSKKSDLIKEYFNFVDECINHKELSVCVSVLYRFAEIQTVLYGSTRSVDLYKANQSLLEILRKNSIESIYLLFTIWRITEEKKYLKSTVSAIVEFIKLYYLEYEKINPDMNLNQDMNGMMISKKLDSVELWLEYVAKTTAEIFEKYKELNWLSPVDHLVDDMIFTDQISAYEMLHYSILFKEDDKKTIQQKAVCNHGYGVWIKTTDIMYIVCDIFRILQTYSDEKLKKMNAPRRWLVEQHDNMLKVRDYYTENVFSHRAYYLNNRRYIDSQIMIALEEDADYFNESVNDLVDITSAITADNIDELLQAKQRYLKRMSGFMSDQQEAILEEQMLKVADQIQEKIRKLPVYNNLYAAISKDFLPYAPQLMCYPQILSALVSAEYLYNQYVENTDDNPQFDYSCISIMYYMSLEEFANKLVYQPYHQAILSTLPKSAWKGYVSHPSVFWDKKEKSYKLSCEIGNLGYLFNGIKDEPEFKKYLNSQFASINFPDFIAFGKKLIDIAPRRNNAAHGGKILTYSVVKEDKNKVFAVNAKEYKGLILEMLGILFPTC